MQYLHMQYASSNNLHLYKQGSHVVGYMLFVVVYRMVIASRLKCRCLEVYCRCIVFEPAECHSILRLYASCMNGIYNPRLRGGKLNAV